MKNRFFAACAILVAAPLLAFAAEPIKGIIPLKSGGEASISAVKDNLKTIKVRKQAYGPRDADFVILQIDLRVANETDAPIKVPNSVMMEVAFADAENAISFVDSAFFSDVNPFEETSVAAGQGVDRRIHFAHRKGLVPVALVNDRKDSIALMPETDPRFLAAAKIVRDIQAVESLMASAQGGTYAEVSAALEAGGLPLDVTDQKGLTLVYHAIMAKNEALLAALVKAGSDIHHRADYLATAVEPIHAAVIADNVNAFRALMKAGADPYCSIDGGDTPIAMAIRQNKVAFLPVFAELGVDFTKVKIRLVGSGDNDPLTFSKKKGNAEMAAFFEEYAKKHPFETK